MSTDRAPHALAPMLVSRLTIPVLAGISLLAVLVHGCIVAFYRSFVFRDFDVHREVGRRFLSGEHLYANDLCYAYMPIAAMYFSPLALVERSTGLIVRYVLAVACLAATLVLFYRMTAPIGSRHRKDLYLLGGGSIVLVFQFLLQDLDDGGPHLILLGILAAAIFAVWKNRQRLGCVLFGLAIVLKLTPGIFLLLFAWKRQWRLLAHTIVATACWLVLPILWMGPASWWTHQAEWGRNAVLSVIDRQVGGRQDNEQRIRNQALRPTLLRYLVTYPADHPMRKNDPAYAPLLNLPSPVAGVCVIAAAAGLLAMFARFSSRAFDSVRDKAWPRECAGVLVLALLLSPMTWQQHLAWLLPGAFVVLAAARFGAPLKTLQWMALGIYAMLAVVLNYEVLGKSRFGAFLSYHPFGIAMIVLFGLIVGARSGTRGALSANTP
ncbi:MAG TPA: glycosyltransferase family 87 protein, partial [Nitrospira sp.]|nr:glycosyltransferase family 87 protein [Nitrospira sp.]